MNIGPALRAIGNPPRTCPTHFMGAIPSLHAAAGDGGCTAPGGGGGAGGATPWFWTPTPLTVGGGPQGGAPIGPSPLLILTLCGSERALVVSTEPLDDLSCLRGGKGGCGSTAPHIRLGPTLCSKKAPVALAPALRFGAEVCGTTRTPRGGGGPGGHPTFVARTLPPISRPGHSFI